MFRERNLKWNWAVLPFHLFSSCPEAELSHLSLWVCVCLQRSCGWSCLFFRTSVALFSCGCLLICSLYWGCQWWICWRGFLHPEMCCRRSECCHMHLRKDIKYSKYSKWFVLRYSCTAEIYKFLKEQTHYINFFLWMYVQWPNKCHKNVWIFNFSFCNFDKLIGLLSQYLHMYTNHKYYHL